MRARMRACVHVCMCACVYVCMCVCVYVCMCVSVYLYRWMTASVVFGLYIPVQSHASAHPSMFDAVVPWKGCVMSCFCVSSCFHPCAYVFHSMCVCRDCVYVCMYVWMCDCVTVWMCQCAWCWTDVMCAHNHVAFAVAWLDCDLTCFTCENSTSNGCLSCAGVYPYFYERTHECLMNRPISVWCNTSNFCFGM